MRIYLLVFMLGMANLSIAQVNIREADTLPVETQQRITLLKNRVNSPEDMFLWRVDCAQWLQETFTIFDHRGKTLTYQSDRIVPRANGLHSWFGKNVETGRFTLLVFNTKLNTINGQIYLSDGEYVIHAIGNGITAVVPSRNVKDEPCGTQALLSQTSTPMLNKNRQRSMPGLDCNLRVLVAYTQQMEDAQPDVRGRIQWHVDVANLSYLNSQIDFEIEVAHLYKVNYTETPTTEICWIDGLGYPSISTDLCRFHHNGDGYMDEVHVLRDQYRADACVLYVDTLPPGIGGQSFLPPVITGGEAFAVVRWDNSPYTFAHEVGHIQGCHHEYPVDGTITNNHGHVHVGSTLDSSFATVMAYGVACQSEFNDTLCPRIPYFSHPDITFLGVPVGVEDPGGNGAMNAINIMNLKGLINGFRDYPTTVDMGFDVMIDDEFVYSVSQNSWQNLGLYEGQAGSQTHLRSEGHLDFKPGMHMKAGAFFEAKVSSACDPPDLNAQTPPPPVAPNQQR